MTNSLLNALENQEVLFILLYNLLYFIVEL